MTHVPRRLRLRSPRAGWLGGMAALLVGAAVLPLPTAQAVERGPGRSTSAAISAAAATAETEARVIVKYKAGSTLMRALSVASGAAAATTVGDAPPQHAQVLGLRLGLPLADGRPTGPRSQAIRAPGVSSADLAARLSAQSDVEYAVVDQRVRIAALPNDPLFTDGQTTVTPAVGQWYLRTPGVDGQVASINAPAAWNITSGLASVVVAVIDTGITTHPDLTGKVLAGYDFISDATVAADGDGRDSDPTDPGDGVTAGEVSGITGCVSSDVGTSSWHGTQTAGLIGAATNNGVGMASVGYNVMVMPLRALGKCGGSESDVAAAIRWAAGIAVSGVPTNTRPAKVINLSLGGTSGVACDAEYQDAVSQAIAQGVVVVAAAGNDGLALGAPANCTGVIGVAGVRHIGTKVGYSDLGPNVTIAAPAGNCVNTTGTCLYPLLTTSNNGAYAVGTPIYTDGDTHVSLGTSFSTPLVAGTVALMFSANPSLTPAQVKSALMSTARAFPSSGAPSSQQTSNGPFVPVAACQAPSGTAQAYECYCTTSTCGAGLLDTGAAVAAVAATATPVAKISASATSVVVGTAVTFDGSGSVPPGNRTIASYQWTLASGSSIAAFGGATNLSSVSVATSAAGSFVVSLTVTDSAGQTSTTTSAVTVTAANAGSSSGSTGSSGSSSSSSGGGAMSPVWLLGLLAASAALARMRSRSGRR